MTELEQAENRYMHLPTQANQHKCQEGVGNVSKTSQLAQTSTLRMQQNPICNAKAAANGTEDKLIIYIYLTKILKRK